MPQIPYVRSGEKLHITAKTLNTVAEHINGAATISAGKPIKGGGGGSVPVVQDNTADIFKIKKSTHDYDIDVSGGNVILGSDILQCLGSIFIVSFQYSTSDTAGTQYVVLTVSYNSQNNTYNAELSLKYSPAYPNNLYNFQYTIGKVDFVKENNATKISNIEQWHYPNHIIITDRWS